MKRRKVAEKRGPSPREHTKRRTSACRSGQRTSGSPRKSANSRSQGSKRAHPRRRSTVEMEQSLVLVDRNERSLEQGSQPRNPGNPAPRTGESGGQVSSSPAPAKRCAIYTRKSLASGLEQDFNSLDAQREACEHYIKSQVHANWRARQRSNDAGGCSAQHVVRLYVQKLMY